MSIEILDPIVASRIAAGEVVERPASALRELLDNAIDSGADRITVWLEEGGIKRMVVSDNGSGIPSSEIALAFKSHATSKIKTLDDLYKLSSLGFRGEALCSIAAVSRLTIQSDSMQMTSDNGQQGPLVPGSVREGTTVTMEDLFENLPARKQFLRRASSEANDCRKVFVEKALGFENIEFMLFNDGKQELRFPVESRLERCKRAMGITEVTEMSLYEDPVRLYAVAGLPSEYRRDRTQVRIFVNNRVVDSYQLVQAVTSSYSVALPGGVFPYFYLFIENSPSLTDFNIHPSKRECKLRNGSAVYGMVTRMIRDSLLKRSRIETQTVIHPAELFTDQPAESNEQIRQQPNTHINYADIKPRKDTVIHAASKDEKFQASWLENAKRIFGEENARPMKVVEKKTRTWNYLGQVFRTFLLVENAENLLIIDQHAAHERILFEELKNNPDVQKLIVPFRFETEPDVDSFLTGNSFIYQDMGITLARVEPMVWEIVSIPAACRKTEDKIASYIKTACGDIETVKKDLFAVIACHAAIKAGDIVDPATATALIEKVFELDAMLCPHGRSFTWVISHKELNHLVGRDI